MSYARPPQNIEAEQALLACPLQHPASLHTVTHIKPEDFYSGNGRLSENGEIWKAILTLSSEGKPYDDPVVVMGQVAAGRVKAEYLAGLRDLEVITANVSHYADLVRETAIRREMLTRANEMRSLAHKDEELEVILSEAERGILSLRRGITNRAIGLDTLIEDAWRGIVNRKESGVELMGLPTGLVDLDKITLGYQQGDIIILAGRPSMGKTAKMLHSALATARTGVGVLIFSLDMAKGKLALRLLAQESEIDGNRLKKAKLLGRKELESIKRATARLASLPIFIDDSRGSTVMEMVAKARELSTRVKLGLVCVDYLQLCQGSKTYRGNRNAEVTEISGAMKTAAGLDDLGCAWLALSQLSRACEERSNKRPILSDLRSSGSLEQDADIVIFVYRASMYHKAEVNALDEVELIVGKHRDGTTGTAKALLNVTTGKFYDQVRKEEPF